ncbi:MAG: VOC family protein [Steroidobacteraceae bacterium]|nr:VOC family protein [Steroidobacteraceae bacterium]
MSGPVQIAYHVPDPRAAAERFAREFGWGPFYVMEHIPLARSSYRGTPTRFDHTSAYGQGGSLMIELITQHGDEPSALRDLYAPHESGVHHVAHFVPDLAAALAHWQARGRAIALDAETADGTRFAMVDTSAELGHMLELYEPRDNLAKFYAWIKRRSEGWDGRDPVRTLG